VFFTDGTQKHFIAVTHKEGNVTYIDKYKLQAL